VDALLKTANREKKRKGRDVSELILSKLSGGERCWLYPEKGKGKNSLRKSSKEHWEKSLVRVGETAWHRLKKQRGGARSYDLSCQRMKEPSVATKKGGIFDIFKGARKNVKRNKEKSNGKACETSSWF